MDEETLLIDIGHTGLYEDNISVNIIDSTISANISSDVNVDSSNITNTVTTSNYKELTNLPSINGVILIDNKTSQDLNIEGDKTYYHNQTIASDEWVIVHNLNKMPSVSVIDSAGDEVIGDVHYDNVNQITITFSGAFKGFATLN